MRLEATGTSLEMPSVPARSMSPSTVTSCSRVYPIASATIWQVTWAQAAEPPSRNPRTGHLARTPNPGVGSGVVDRPSDIYGAGDRGVLLARFGSRVIREDPGSFRYFFLRPLHRPEIHKLPPEIASFLRLCSGSTAKDRIHVQRMCYSIACLKFQIRTSPTSCTAR